MAAVLLFICAASFLWWLVLAMEWAAAARSTIELSDLPAPAALTIRLSVIIPARNEERTLERALASVLAALPEDGEAILVNDRSTDGTRSIAENMAGVDRRLTVLTVNHLPEGWLGKNHAMWEGYRVSTGDCLLFTDADVVFEPDCLRKAMFFCEKQGADHLVALPSIVTRGFWERTFVSFFSVLLMARYRMWRAPNPHSRFYAGVGAFNMVRRNLYEDSGTHEALREEAVDDLLLGRLFKRAGGRTIIVSGTKCLKVRWNFGLRGLMAGLEKNSFAVFDYNLVKAAVGIVVLLTGTMVPALAPVFLSLPAESSLMRFAALSGLCVWSIFALLYRLASYPTGASWLYFLTFPVGVFLLSWTIARSALLYHIRGGIKWRGTVYKKTGGKNPEAGSQNSE